MNSAFSAIKRIRIDRTTPLSAQPDTGHNRWHSDILPILRVEPGEIVELETRDVCDGQIAREPQPDEVARLDGTRVAPLTGPVYVIGAEPGDLLCIEMLSVLPENFGFSICSPRYGIIKQHITETLVSRWDIENGAATTPSIPGIRIPGAPFIGTIGVAPSHDMLERSHAIETRLAQDGRAILPVEPKGAVPASAKDGLRTLPPRANGGNLDIRQLCAGSVLRLPVHVPGALFSAGDAHFAQGDNECCTGIEIGATLQCRFSLLKGLARLRDIHDAQVYRKAPGAETRASAIFCTTGLSCTDASRTTANDLNKAAEHALLNMIDHLGHEYGYTAAQAATICSLAVDLKISQAANSPNYLVTAVLPLDIFTS